MERAPFGWNQPADFDSEDWPVQIDGPARTERPAPTERLARTDRAPASELQFEPEQPAYSEPPAYSEQPAHSEQPAYSELPLNFERYNAAYQAEKRWFVDDTPKLGRDARIAYVLFVVALAVAGVWVIQRDVQGPVPQEEASQPSTDPPSARAATPPREELGLGTPLQGVDDLPGASATADLPAAPSVDPSLPGGSVEAGGSKDQSLLDADAGKAKAPPPPDTSPRLPRTFEPPPLKGQTVDAGVQTRKPTQPPPARRPPAIAPPPRPPYRPTFGEPAAPPSRAAAEPTPAPVPAPATSAPSAETAPSSPRAAVGEAVPRPLPPAAAAEPALASPATPPPAAVATPPPAATPTPAASAAAPSATPTTASSTLAADADNGAIRDVLGRYRSAFNTLDAKAAQQVWPSVNERTLDRAFGQLEQQNVSFDTCAILVKGALAKANCRGTTRFVPRVGSRSAQVEPRQWSFSLRKANSGGWLIQEVQAQ
jgi:hypothetical protein